jgi:hypothetical protein
VNKEQEARARAIQQSQIGKFLNQNFLLMNHGATSASNTPVGGNYNTIQAEKQNPAGLYVRKSILTS